MIRRAWTVIVLGGCLAALPCPTHAAPPASPGSHGAPFANPAPPCFDNVNRYVDCGNGTVTDTVTGLLWLRDAGCLGLADWATASTSASALKHGDCGLSDRSRAGDWRLPTPEEWAATIAHAVALDCRQADYPSLTNNAGTACLEGTPVGSGSGEHAFVNVPSGTTCTALNDTACNFWASASSESIPTLATRARLFHGLVNDAVIKTQPQAVWPVRNR